MDSNHPDSNISWVPSASRDSGYQARNVPSGFSSSQDYSKSPYLPGSFGNGDAEKLLNTAGTAYQNPRVWLNGPVGHTQSTETRMAVVPRQPRNYSSDPRFQTAGGAHTFGNFPPSSSFHVQTGDSIGSALGYCPMSATQPQAASVDYRHQGQYAHKPYSPYDVDTTQVSPRAMELFTKYEMIPHQETPTGLQMRNNDTFGSIQGGASTRASMSMSPSMSPYAQSTPQGYVARGYGVHEHGQNVINSGGPIQGSNPGNHGVNWGAHLGNDPPTATTSHWNFPGLSLPVHGDTSFRPSRMKLESRGHFIAPKHASSRYLGDPNSKSFASQIDGLADDENCALWLTRIHPRVTLAHLLSLVRTGAVFAVTMVAAKDDIFTQGAKLVFMRHHGAARFLDEVNSQRGIVLGGIRMSAIYNRHGYRDNHTQLSRVLWISGHPSIEELNRSWFQQYFDMCVMYELEGFEEWYDEAKGIKTLEFRFARVDGQAEALWHAIHKDTCLQGKVSVQYGPDPCDPASHAG